VQLRIQSRVQLRQAFQQTAFGAAQHQQQMFAGQIQRLAGVAPDAQHGARTDRQCLTLQGWRGDQDGEAIAKFEQARAHAGLAARGELVQQRGELLLAGVDQAERLLEGVLAGARRRLAQMMKVLHQTGQAMPQKRLPALDQALAHGEVALLVQVIAGAFGLLEEAPVECVQALQHGFLQPALAGRHEFGEQALRARRPGQIVARQRR
jgi:hypothetical protein